MEPLDRLREQLRANGLMQAVLSHPESLAHFAGFYEPVEDWPVANPFLAAPTLLLIQPEDVFLVVPSFSAGHAQRLPWTMIESRTHLFVGTPPDPVAEFTQVIHDLPIESTGTAVEAGHLPLRVARLLEGRGAALVPADELVASVREAKGSQQVEAIRAASRLADVVQQSVKAHAAAGISEAELAGLASAAMYEAAGARVPAILTVTAGEATATGGGTATGRALQAGDLVLTDTAPWLRGAWSDSANAVVVGGPSVEQRRMFDAVRAALALAIDLCRPGSVAGDIDRKVRESLSGWGESYAHHTGHGIGASWTEPPHIIPGSTDVIEEGMVVALEPAIYAAGLGGIRLEHVIHVQASGNELLTQFEHTL
jgi:Xaa-Pro aminopeptidase